MKSVSAVLKNQAGKAIGLLCINLDISKWEQIHHFILDLMNITPFKLEEFWKKYEFTTPYLLCCSDAETWGLEELISLADSESKKLWQSLSLGYTEPPGHPLLRKEIAALYSTLGPEDVFTFAGYVRYLTTI